MKWAFKAISIFWIISPAVFAGMRAFGIFNFGYDWLIFLFLTMMSTAAIFFNYKANDEDM